MSSSLVLAQPTCCVLGSHDEGAQLFVANGEGAFVRRLRTSRSASATSSHSFPMRMVSRAAGPYLAQVVLLASGTPARANDAQACATVRATANRLTLWPAKGTLS